MIQDPNKRNTYMKIAILASGTGEKALHLYEFFKEGNRVEIVDLLTDDPESEVARRFAEENIPVENLARMDEDMIRHIMETMAGKDVELLVVDGYRGEIPSPLAEGFGEAVLYPTGVNEAPLEVIEAVKRLKDKAAAEEEEREKQREEEREKAREERESQKEAERKENAATAFEAGTMEDEWARALNVKDPSDLQADSPEQEISESPESKENTGFSQVGPPPVNQGTAYGRGETQAPPAVPQDQREKMPDTYLVWSVLATLLCCLITGIVAIVYSSSVSSKYYNGDIEGAKRASRNAQIWVIVSVVVGIIWGTLYMPLALITG